MNRFAFDRSTRLAALAGLAALLWFVVAPAAQAQVRSGFTYLPADGNLQVLYTHQSTSYLKREVRDNGGALIETVNCPAPLSNCFPALPPNAATFAVSLEGFNSAREEIVSERCGNVASTVPQQFCVDGELHMTLRVRTGGINTTLLLTPVGSSQLLDTGVATMRMAFTEDPTRYWELPVGSQPVAPAGSYRVSSPDLRGPCQPTHTNPGAALDIPVGGTGNVTLSYRRTLCTFTVSIRNSDTIAAGVVESVDGVLACGDPNRLANSCTGTFAPDSVARFTGRAAPGYRVQFNNNPLSSFCNYPLTAPDRCDVVTSADRYVRMEAFPGVTPPPPPPPPLVTLAFAAGAATPADRTATKGEVGVPMLQLRATPANGRALIHALTLRASGSGRDDLDLPSLRVVLDANGNGRADSGETVLAQGRPTVDNGSMRLAFTTPLALTTAAHLLVVADVADTVNSAAALGVAGAGLALAGFALWPVGYTRRRARWSLMAAVLLAAALVTGCGGGGGDDPGVQPPPPPPPPPPPAAVTLTYRIELTAVDATDDASPAGAVNVVNLPITGARVTVTQ